MATNVTVGDPAGNSTTKTNSGPGYLSNGSIFLIPGFENTPWFPYANLKDQMIDARNAYTQGSGGFKNMNTPMFQAIQGFQPMVGGGLLGASAYTGAFNGGFNPFLGRGNPTGGPPGGGGPPSGGGGPGGPGGPPPPPPGTPGLPGPGSPPGVRPPRTPMPGGTPSLPPIGSGPPPTQVPGTSPGALGGLLNGSNTQPLQPKTTQPSGLLSGAPQGQPMQPVKPAPYDINELKLPGATQGQTDINSMVAYINQLPDSQKLDYFNAISQYGLSQGQNLGGALMAALKQAGGYDALAAQMNAAGGYSGIKSTQGLPAWLIQGLGG